MADIRFPRDLHPPLSPEQDQTQRGRTQDGEADQHADNPHVRLPPVDPAFRPSNTIEDIDFLLREARPWRRPQTLFPYLMIRSVAGDRGVRPLWPPIPCWESCEIHLIPEGTAAFDFGATVLQPVVGQSYRVVVHLWNLGRFAAFGGRLRVWWVEPGFFNGSADPRYAPHFIGGTYFDLGDRDSAEAHRLVEIPTPWTVVKDHDAHECLIAVIDCATDPWDGDMNANTHRHVAQRNLNLVSGAEDLAPLLGRLAAMMSDRESELLITHASVTRASFVGAQARGAAQSSESPAGWNHSGLVFGNENLPVALFRRDAKGLRLFDLSKTAEMPLPFDKLPKGVALRSGWRRELAVRLRGLLGLRKLSAASVALALGGANEPRLLRFIATERKGGRSMGYSVIVAP